MTQEHEVADWNNIERFLTAFGGSYRYGSTHHMSDKRFALLKKQAGARGLVVTVRQENVYVSQQTNNQKE